jgi:SAM-dependent methyltransferase
MGCLRGGNYAQDVLKARGAQYRRRTDSRTRGSTLRKRIRLAAGLAAGLLLCYFAIETVNRQLLTNTFNRIYTEGTWGRDAAGKGTSGTGSTLEITREYRAYIEDFMKRHAVKSVVDAGCGDWTFSSAVDWGDASYLGVDIASDVIAVVRAKHEKGKIRFQVGDITDELPAADLLISKDVLQHLSNTLVSRFIRNNLRKGKYKWVILTNDRGSENHDVANGGFRAIDLAAPPFDVRGLIDLPITFGDETTKITSLLDFTQRP